MPTEIHECKTIELDGLENEPRMIGGFNAVGELIFVHAKKPVRHWTRREDESPEAFHARVVADVRAAMK